MNGTDGSIILPQNRIRQPLLEQVFDIRPCLLIQPAHDNADPEQDQHQYHKSDHVLPKGNEIAGDRAVYDIP